MPPRQMYFDPATSSPSNYHWLPWLQKALLLQGVLTQTPEMPTPYEPDFTAWSEMLERIGVDERTTLVGHSAGAGFLVRWLSELPAARVRKAVLVAPWIDPRQQRTRDFFDFTIDPALTERCGEFVVFHSDNEGDETVRESAQILQARLPKARFREFHLGHFSHWDMPSPEFPELLDEVLR